MDSVNKDKNDVIAAVGTPRGRGAISCVRLSGEGSAEIVKKLTRGIKEIKHAVMNPCRFKGRIKDRIMAVVYFAPESYTGEESAELYFHGGTFITEQALLSVIDCGARLAEAGEFTRRAFLNGKIDLTQAEGIGDLIDSDSFASAEAAYEQSEGKIRNAVNNIYETAVTAAARAEVSIDYPEEDIEEQTREELRADISNIIKETDRELKGYDGGRIRREGARVVITGKTNAGKSTLFNTLLGEERAIVSDEEGTTRDTVEEKMIYKGEAFVLIDTAGIRETDSKAEKMGIERSFDAVNNADIILRVINDISEINENSLDLNEVIVLNSFKYSCDNVSENESESGAMVLNAESGYGVEKLKEELYERAKKKIAGGGCINNARQYNALKNAKECLQRALDATENMTIDCVCADMRGALEYLASVTGRNVSESVIGEIFSKFCVGK